MAPKILDPVPEVAAALKSDGFCAYVAPPAAGAPPAGLIPLNRLLPAAVAGLLNKLIVYSLGSEQMLANFNYVNNYHCDTISLV